MVSGKYSPSEVINKSIDRQCCLTLPDPKDITDHTFNKPRTKSNMCTSYWKSSKFIVFFGIVISILIILSSLKFAGYVIFLFNSLYNTTDLSYAEIHMDHDIKEYYPHGKELFPEAKAELIDEVASFSDRIERLKRAIRTVNDKAPMRNLNNPRFKRDLSRNRRYCNLNAEYCKRLLQSIQNYLEVFSNKTSATPQQTITELEHALTCLKCKNQSSIIANEHLSPLHNKEQYFMHDYVDQDYSNDSDITVIELLDNKKNNDDLSLHDNSTGNNGINEGTTTIQMLETNSVLNNASDDIVNTSMVIIPIDHMNSNRSLYIHANTSSSDNGNLIDYIYLNESQTNNSQVTFQNDQYSSSPTIIDDETTEDTSIRNNVATLRFTTTSSDTETTDNILGVSTTSELIVVTSNSQVESTEMKEQNLSINLTEQNVIIESPTTIKPATYNVSGINMVAINPSVHPSFEGHPEEQSFADANDSRNAYRLSDGTIVPPNDSQAGNSEQARQSMKSFEQLQLNPLTSWTIPHPVCFYGYPGQSNNNKQGQNQAYSQFPSSSGSSFMQHRPTFQNGLGFGQTASPSPPNYVQVQAQSVQFLPRANYMGNSVPSQSVQQGVGPTGPAAANIPTFSGNQQTGTSALSSTGGTGLSNTPYFCTYISLPILKFPSLTGMPQYNRYSVDKGDNPIEQQKNADQRCGHLHNTASIKTCPSNSQPCIADGYCVPKIKWCDGFVDCSDSSDETMCSCKDRISRNRLCDGYFDCPQGEDESSCFGCPADSFSCHDWDRRDNCVPLSQRCDGVNQCSNGNDELDCNILSENYLNLQNTFTIGYTQGYLHKNVGGKWYPVCSNALSWAMDACSSEAGQPITMEPEIQAVRLSTNDFQGPYVTEISGQIQFVDSCPHKALYVRCPSLSCGTTAFKSRDSTPVVDTLKNNIQDLYKIHTETHATSKNLSMNFDKLYQGMINLLHKNHTDINENEVDRNSSIVASQQLRVVGGRTSEPRAWPFLVAIYKDGIFHCGGVILNKIWVLTAAHCMKRSQTHYYEVYAGILRQSSFSPMSQTRRARYIILHPAYNDEAMQNDIALIMLDKPFYFNRWIRQVCLPSENTAGIKWKQGPPLESTCIAIGWGSIAEHGPDPDHLREVEVPILSSCKYPLDQNNSTICAGYTKGGRDACQGDSGGPLMCRNPNFESQWYVAGIISHGEGCARPNEPGTYMKVSYFVHWIKTIIEELSLPQYGIIPLSKCPGFVCQDELGKCLSINQRCNWVVDCLNGEDEMDCSFKKGYMHYRQLDFNNKSSKFNPEIESSEETFDKIIKTLSTSSIETIPVATESEIETDGKNKDVIFRNVTKMSSELFRVHATFTCTELLQTIEIEKRCDRHLDCEDGTDEDECTCRDFLSRLQPESICDGHLDCDDETDETYCDTCQKDEFLCSRSGVCIPIASKCDSMFDCPLMEDEIDCFTLTDGKNLYMDPNNRPILNTEGFISMNVNGKWYVKCYGPMIQDDYMSLVGTQTCNYLGFANAQAVENVVIKRGELLVRSWRDNTTNYESSVNNVVPDETCSALRIRCRPIVNSSIEKYVVVNPTTGNYMYLWPWLAAIFIDGHYHCMVLLLKPDWLLSYSRCTENVSLSVNYTTAVLGHSRSYLYVNGPNEQISVIDEIKHLNNSNVTLLHLKYTMNITNYVQPLFLEHQTYPPNVNDTCVSIGTDDEYKTDTQIVLPVVENCKKCDRCYENIQYRTCSYRNNSSWDGTVFCLNDYGWYPTAVFQEDGSCDTLKVRNMTSINYISAYLDQATDEKRQPTAEPVCDGVRCKIGQCISWSKVCDGVSNCRAGEDEEPEICNKKQELCNNTNCDIKICSKNELRCGNGECISKSSFCDGKVDCSDGTDEPVECTCAEYLKLTAPERLCDGVRHCFDKTDESPEICGCTENSYKCDSKNVTCIPYEFVCDGENDCSSGIDETDCTKIQPYSNDRPNIGEVIQQSYGIWHSYCLSAPKTTMTEASNICQMNGYKSGESVYHNIMKRISLVPSRDNFYVIQLNPETWITLRHDKPLISLVKSEESCYGFYVKCN